MFKEIGLGFLFLLCPYLLLVSKYLPFIDLVVSLLFCGCNSSESVWSWAFLWGQILITASISLMDKCTPNTDALLCF